MQCQSTKGQLQYNLLQCYDNLLPSLDKSHFSYNRLKLKVSTLCKTTDYLNQYCHSGKNAVTIYKANNTKNV